MTVLRSCLLLVASLCACDAIGADRVVPDTMAERVLACTACHGSEGRATSDGFFPRIAGKPEGYLYNQLVNFRNGKRANAMMTWLVSNQTDAYLREIAAHFASLNPPHAPPQPAAAPREVLERGRVLATRGDAARKLPACAACHGAALTGALPAVPGLVGLPRDYLSAQLGAWKNKSRRAAAPDCMAELAGRMSADDLNAATAWLAAQPVPADARPAPRPGSPPPLDCGSSR